MKAATIRPGSAVLVAALTGGWFAVASASHGEEPEQQIDVSGSHTEIIGDVAVPIAHEVFSSLDKLGQRDWGEQIFRQKPPMAGTRPELALRFGFVIANGFIAVAAEDGEEVQRIGRDVLRLASALGFEDAVKSHAQAITEGARSREWEATRSELDRARETVRSEMAKMRDHDVAELVSLGGWIGGTHALAETLSMDYSTEGAELLHQPDLINRLSERFAEIPEEKKTAPVFGTVDAALSSVRTLSAPAQIPKESIEQIHALTNNLAAAILGTDTP